MKIFRYGDNVNTDVIIPARYLNDSSEENLKAHAFEDLDSTFASTVEKGDIIIAGENFGCGSSREHAPLAIKASGVKLVIAKSFARIFYRNAINVGLPLLESTDYADKSDDEISIPDDVISIMNTDGFVKSIIKKGGLLEAIK